MTNCDLEESQIQDLLHTDTKISKEIGDKDAECSFKLTNHVFAF